MVARVLLAEDDSDDIHLFTTFFATREDISLLPVVRNGLELVDYLMNVASDKDLPDLILLDQNMPLMNGQQTCNF